MRWNLIVTVLAGLTAIVSTDRADAHPLYRKLLAEKHDAHVTCAACHLSRDASEKLSPEEREHYRFHSKEFYNNFGQQLRSLLVAKGTDQHMASYYSVPWLSWDEKARQARQRRRDEIREKAANEFLDVLSEFEQIRDDSTGNTYGELLKTGEIDGIRLRTEPQRMPSDR